MSSLHTVFSRLSARASSTSTLGLNRLFSTTSVNSNSCRGLQGRCGIPPMAKKKEIKIEKKVVEMASNLIKPPCIPEGRIGRYPPLCSSKIGFECPRNVVRYRYPAYSECCKRPHKVRRLKECCYYPPPPCGIVLVKPTEK